MVANDERLQDVLADGGPEDLIQEIRDRASIGDCGAVLQLADTLASLNFVPMTLEQRLRHHRIGQAL